MYKIRPVVDDMKAKVLSVPMKECPAVDEQICDSKARHHLKLHMTDIPQKRGFKLHFLRVDDGFRDTFEVNTGDDYQFTNRLSNEPNLGCSGDVVVLIMNKDTFAICVLGIFILQLASHNISLKLDFYV